MFASSTPSARRRTGRCGAGRCRRTPGGRRPSASCRPPAAPAHGQRPPPASWAARPASPARPPPAHTPHAARWCGTTPPPVRAWCARCPRGAWSAR
ncbi:MAG TPA: hypothetical protein DHW47_06215, partial [Oscillibacter sp.]|nr:hypothetical protein [Oscillibacter sp.]